jgi:hypothetical protein
MKHLLFVLFLALPALLIAQNKPEYKVAAVGFYNLENLFDTLDSPNTNDADFLPTGRLLWNTEKYISKQANMAKVISMLGTELNPDGVALLGVAEVENRKVLEDLVSRPELRDRNYQIAHFDSPDERGIDCGLLYQEKYFRLTSAQALPVGLKEPKDTSGVVDYTRDVLYIAGLMDGEPVHVMVCHWPSRRGGESASAWMRAAAAAVCRRTADSIQSIQPDARIIVMGDLNDDPNNKSLTEVLQAEGDAEKVGDSEFYNPMYSEYKNGNGTLAYRDSWNLFDQVVVSKPFTAKRYGGWQLYKTVIFKQPWMMQTEGAYKGYPFRTYVGDNFMNGYSDHLPVYLFFLKRA